MEPPRKRNPKALATALIVLIVAGAAAGGWWVYIDDYHYAVVQEGVLYRDGNRSLRNFKTAHRRSNFKTVVCLVSDREFGREEFQDEVKFCQEKGAELIRIPIAEGGSPTPGDVEKFLAIAQDKSKQPVLVHCAQGVMRTGMMVAAYQQRVLGYDRDKAMNSILLFGKGVERADGVKAFIDKQYAQSQPAPTTSQARGE